MIDLGRVILRRTGALGITAAAMILVAATAAHAQWPGDPAVNLSIADRPSEQVVPLVAGRSDGGTYVAWRDKSPGHYVVYLQRLNAAGVEQWPHNGILISDHPQNSALFGWDMKVDSADNAVLVFSDQRYLGRLNTFAYRVGPGGEMLWGPNGVQLSFSSNRDNDAPIVAEASNGDFVSVWSSFPDVGDGVIQMQRLTAGGVPLLAQGGIPVVASAGETPGFAAIVPAEHGNVILSWVRNMTISSATRYIRANKFSPAGTPLWASNTEVYNALSVPVGYQHLMVPDEAGGAVIAWHRSDGTYYNSFVQHIDKSGAEVFPHNGVAVSTTAGFFHIGPGLAYDKSTQESFVFWDERTPSASAFGVYGQKFSRTGGRQWGNGGAVLIPMNSVTKSIPRVGAYGGGAMVFFLDQPTGYGTDRLLGMRVDGSGTQIWAGSPVLIASTPSSKLRYPLAMAPNGVVTLVWEDNRNGSVDVFGQNIGPTGNLGPSAILGSVGVTPRVKK